MHSSASPAVLLGGRGGGGGSQTHPQIILGLGRYLGISEYLSRLRDNLPHPRIIPGWDGS